MVVQMKESILCMISLSHQSEEITNPWVSPLGGFESLPIYTSPLAIDTPFDEPKLESCTCEHDHEAKNFIARDFHNNKKNEVGNLFSTTLLLFKQ